MPHDIKMDHRMTTPDTTQPNAPDTPDTPDTPEKLDGQSLDLRAQRLAALKAILPEAFDLDGQLVGDKLLEALKPATYEPSDDIPTFGLGWPGKQRAFAAAGVPTTATLRPDPEESVDFDTTQNLLIEGDNLEVLKTLQRSYHGKVKMIYIDPPYNTGKDFVYPDNYGEGLDTYLKRTQQKDEDGFWKSTNSETSGRKHANWLSMMAPRLTLARNLLRDDGVIFISIDDNEVSNLKLLCDDVFGAENFVNLLTIKTKESSGASGGGEDRRLKKNAEHLMFYAKKILSMQREEAYQEVPLRELLEEKARDGKSYEYSSVLVDHGKLERLKTIKDGSGEDITIYKHVDYVVSSVKNISRQEDVELAEVYNRYHDKIFRTTNAQTSILTRVHEATEAESGLISIEYTPRSGRDKGQIVRKYFSGRFNSEAQHRVSKSEASRRTVD